MIYKIRVILDAEEDVFRDLEVERDCSLEELHNVISQSFGFLGNEMASFFTADEAWNQEEEIPLFDMREGQEGARLMRDTPLGAVMDEGSPKLLYVYDFLSMWTFFVELADVAEKEVGKSYPNLLFSFGELPDSPPEKQFEADPGMDFEEPLDHYDDLDFDENWN
ncbi:plasmid pRiA4b ORF-3 family protein [Robiginitalea marina]|uniref:Plasmid pRiA4b ORF-3 family protein n=1 Tax=Robiginitalea marina TaxID=2954105 RepID=A0ABT1AVI3_9FLAO|nr:plasmid pRiA4b ORF-3 family protein [Robiginitalea marina]MCO5724026.1 plasmid pRiA4b ORF-3 family protein [Robiginitalea marina]